MVTFTIIAETTHSTLRPPGPSERIVRLSNLSSVATDGARFEDK